MTDQEKIDWILMVLARDGGERAGELVFEFMRAVHADKFRWCEPTRTETEVRRWLDSFVWYYTPQGKDYWWNVFTDIGKS